MVAWYINQDVEEEVVEVGRKLKGKKVEREES
jgi:hypothetical protein